ncbi:putative NAD-specific glutamate dehydrogenase encoded in antisense gene pair with dnaKJ [Yoonia vestfoldensis SKA53]|uniref:Putative NAD-specific glutamate dehydrogenase encoded in antisense gene pair with dnaKJ n=1 Tax=Yoonia vestfoldensis SKA53 TaxID=314232 RepID=A3V2A1_9RHOB|nr:putative NAD-specific glutamate dehydrogenase encoded in antisense gene pair with dnaKJ [Yoonia vestfoldensis SKA53]
MNAGFDLACVVAFQIVLECCNRQFDRFDRGWIDLVGMFFHRFFGRVDQAFGLIFCLDQFAASLVGLGIRLGVFDHCFDVVIRQTARRLDGDFLFFASAFVLGTNLDNAVGVDVECHLDLGHAAGGWWDVFKVELAQHLVVSGHLTFALEHPQGHGILVVFGGREDLRFFRRDRRVAVDQAGEYATQRFDPQRQWCDVQQDHILDVALQNTGLNGGTHGDNLVRVDTLMRFFAKEFGHFFLDLRHAGHAADQNDLVDVGCGQARILDRGLTRFQRCLDQIANKAFQLGTGQFHDHVQRLAVRPHRDEWLVDFGTGGRRQFDLGLFGSFLQTLQGHLVLGQIDGVLFFELVGKVVDDPHVEIFTTKERITVCGFDFEQTVVDFQNGHVESTAAKVIDRDGFAFFLVQTVSQRRGCRFVDDAQHFQPGNFTGVLGGLTLGVVEIGRHGDDGLRHFFAQIAFGGLFHLAQNERGNLAGRIFVATRLHPSVAIATINNGERHVLFVFGKVRIVKATPDQALDGENRVFGVGHGLAFCRLTDKAFVVSKCND